MILPAHPSCERPNTRIDSMDPDTDYRVFISHSSVDAWTARQIEGHVRDQGAEAFLSTLDVEGGDDFGTWMRDSMDLSDECLVLYTPEAAASRNVWVEVGGAWMARKRVVILLSRLSVEDVTSDPKFPHYLKSLDFRDLNTEFDSKYLVELEGRVQGGSRKGTP